MAEELSLREAAARLGQGVRALRHAAANGRLEARKVGAQWVTTTDAVRVWEARHPPRTNGEPVAYRTPYVDAAVTTRDTRSSAG